MKGALLRVEGVSKVFGRHNPTHAVDDVSLALEDSPQIVSIVGESGSGKSTLARLILGLETPSAGRILFRDVDIARADRARRKDFRRQVQAVFQNPYAALNPVYRVERLFRVPIRKFRLCSCRAEADRAIPESLRSVGLDPRETLKRYPHQLSGGQRQRLLLARIHLIRPRLIIADEPVSMVDAVQRVSFLEILLGFSDRLGVSTLFITHDLSTVRLLGGDVLVLHRGRLIEKGSTEAVTSAPAHPYTRLLIDSIPLADPGRRWEKKLPDASRALANGLPRQACLYAARCPQAIDCCWRSVPKLVARDIGGSTRVTACHLYPEVQEGKSDD